MIVDMEREINGWKPCPIPDSLMPPVVTEDDEGVIALKLMELAVKIGAMNGLSRERVYGGMLLATKFYYSEFLK